MLARVLALLILDIICLIVYENAKTACSSFMESPPNEQRLIEEASFSNSVGLG